LGLVGSPLPSTSARSAQRLRFARSSRTADSTVRPCCWRWIPMVRTADGMERKDPSGWDPEGPWNGL